MTRFFLNHLAKGMTDAGGAIDWIDLNESRINECSGCFHCWSKTPGACCQTDQMTHEFFPKWMDCDLVIYGTPIYLHHMNSLMARFRERTIPGSPPLDKDRSGTNEQIRIRREAPNVVWLSVSGLDRIEEFDSLSHYINSTCPAGSVIAAEIFRPAAQYIRHPVNAAVKKEILKAVATAGRELVTKKRVCSETLKLIQTPLRTSYEQNGNARQENRK